MKHAIVPIAVVIIAILGTGFLVAFTLTNYKQAPEPSVSSYSEQKKSPAPAAAVEGKLLINDNSEVVLEVENADLSAIAIKVNIELSAAPTSPKFQFNNSLQKDNWELPINEVSIHGNSITLELAAINLANTGYSVNQSLILGKLDVGSGVSITSYTFDDNITKIIAKDGHELNLSHN